MTSYRIHYTSEELYHHGILGMKWGQRNGPPYPLDASDHSAGEKRAGWRKSLEASGNGGTYSINKTKQPTNKTLSTLTKRKIELTDQQKKLLKIGAAAVGASVVVYAGYKLYENGAFDSLASKGKSVVDKYITQKTNSPAISSATKNLITGLYGTDKVPVDKMTPDTKHLVEYYQRRADKLGPRIAERDKVEILANAFGYDDKTKSAIDIDNNPLWNDVDRGKLSLEEVVKIAEDFTRKHGRAIDSYKLMQAAQKYGMGVLG